MAGRSCLQPLKLPQVLPMTFCPVALSGHPPCEPRQSLVEQTLTSKRIPRAMDLYRFVLGIVLGLYISFPRLNQLRFMARDPILTGILKVTKLPVQSTFWRFVNALHRNDLRRESDSGEGEASIIHTSGRHSSNANVEKGNRV